MASLYKRACNVVLAHPLNGSFTRTSPVRVVNISELRVSFRVEKTLDPEPNSAEVTIYNLNEQSRGEFQERPLAVRLFGGHDNTPKMLFSGDVFYSTSRYDAPEWLTELQAGDGQRAIRQAKVQRSYRAGLKAVDALREILRSMSQDVPPEVTAMPEMQSWFANGLVLEGPSRRSLTELLNKHGLSWSIQDGQIQILRRNGAAVEPARRVAQDTGLIGSPEFMSPKFEGGPSNVMFSTLLYPELVPGRLVIIESRTANGQYRIDRVTHTGDTHGNDWTTEVECRPL